MMERIRQKLEESDGKFFSQKFKKRLTTAKGRILALTRKTAFKQRKSAIKTRKF